MKKTPKKIKKIVKEGYGKIAVGGTSCCSSGSCCSSVDSVQGIGKIIGYSDNEMNAIPEGANLGLGCGNPVALASLKKEDVVLDLGSGAGIDAFLAAQRVGKKGRVIGVDMTPEMVAKAKENARKGSYANVEFRLGEIERLPVEDNSIDVIISNCVINLSPDKEKVFKEAYRVLKRGGRLMVSDLVLLKELPIAIKESVDAYLGCLAGAIMKNKYIGFIKKVGFENIKILRQDAYPIETMANNSTVNAIMRNSLLEKMNIKEAENSVASIKIYALKKEREK